MKEIYMVTYHWADDEDPYTFTTWEKYNAFSPYDAAMSSYNCNNIFWREDWFEKMKILVKSPDGRTIRYRVKPPQEVQLEIVKD